MLLRLSMILAAALSIAGCMPTKPAATTPRVAQAAGVAGIVLNAVRPCWNVDAGGGSRTSVKLHVARVNPDGTVPPDAVTVVDDHGAPKAAAAARRAVLNPVCQPWPKPLTGWSGVSFDLLFAAGDLL